MTDVFLGLGANLGSRLSTLGAALDLLEAPGDVQVIARSRVYETPAVGPPQPPYLNAAARLRTELPAQALLERALAVERALGRVRRERWGPRLVDLDLLWTEAPVRAPGLEVPHPRLEERPFALAPLLDVMPEAPAALRLRLEALGGPPPLHPGVLGAPPGEARAIDGGWRATCEAPDASDAWAGALTALARAAGGALGGPPGVETRPAAGPSPLARLLSAMAEGWRPRWVLVDDSADPTLRLVGPRGRPIPLEPREEGACRSEGGTTVRLAVACESAK